MYDAEIKESNNPVDVISTVLDAKFEEYQPSLDEIFDLERVNLVRLKLFRGKLCYEL
jgi:hypothetical protein